MNITIKELKELLRLLGEISSKPTEEPELEFKNRDFFIDGLKAKNLCIKELEDKVYSLEVSKAFFVDAVAERDKCVEELISKIDVYRAAIEAHKKNTYGTRASHVDTQLWEAL